MDSKQLRDTFQSLFVRFQEGKPNEKQKLKSIQETFAKMLSSLDQESRPIERLYFGYLLVQLFHQPESSQQLLTDFVRALFPAMLNKRQAALVSDIVSLALTLRDNRLLDCLEFYVKNCDSLTFPKIHLPATLAQDSPLFCSAVISRGYFLASDSTDASKEQLSAILTQWLRTLLDQVPDSTISLNKAIRFAFLDRPVDYELHLVLLSLIRSKKCEQLNNQFIIDLATSVSNSTDNKALLIDRFAQLLIIAYANDMCSQSNQLKSILLNKFPDNKLMKAVCK